MPPDRKGVETEPLRHNKKHSHQAVLFVRLQGCGRPVDDPAKQEQRPKRSVDRRKSMPKYRMKWRFWVHHPASIRGVYPIEYALTSNIKISHKTIISNYHLL